MLSEPPMLSLIGFDSCVPDAEFFEQFYMLLFQLVSVNEDKHLSRGASHHFREQVGLSCPAGRYHEGAVVALFERRYGFAV